MNDTFLLPCLFHTLYNVIATQPKLIHLRDDLWRMLQIAINDNRASPTCIRKPCLHSGLFSKVAAEGDPTHTAVLFGRFFYDGHRIVTRAIVDKNEFIGDVRAAKDGRQAFNGSQEPLFFIIAWNNY